MVKRRVNRSQTNFCSINDALKRRKIKDAIK